MVAGQWPLPRRAAGPCGPRDLPGAGAGWRHAGVGRPRRHAAVSERASKRGAHALRSCGQLLAPDSSTTTHMHPEPPCVPHTYIRSLCLNRSVMSYVRTPPSHSPSATSAGGCLYKGVWVTHAAAYSKLAHIQHTPSQLPEDDGLPTCAASGLRCMHPCMQGVVIGHACLPAGAGGPWRGAQRSGALCGWQHAGVRRRRRQRAVRGAMGRAHRAAAPTAHVAGLPSALAARVMWSAMCPHPRPIPKLSVQYICTSVHLHAWPHAHQSACPHVRVA